MVGERITLTPFDGNKKSGWLFADIHGFFYTWIAMVVLAVLFVGLLYGATGIMILAPFEHLGNFIREHWGSDWMVGMMITTTSIPPFILVFVLRYNFTVIGTRRQFRYVCCWL